MAQAVSISARSRAEPASAATLHPGSAQGLRGTDVDGLGIRDVWRWFWPQTRRYRRWMCLSLLLALLAPVIDAAGIMLFKVLVDDVLAPADFAPFPRIAAAYVAFTLISGLISFADGYLATWIAAGFQNHLRVKVFEHLQRLSLDFFERYRLGDVLSRLTADIAAAEALVLTGLIAMVGYAVRVVLYAGVMFALSWQLALVALVVTPVFALISRAFATRLRAVSRVERRAQADITAVAEESLANMALVQAYNSESSELERIAGHGEQVRRATLRAARLRGFYRPAAQLVELIGLLMVIGYGAWLTSQGRMSLGELLVVMAFFSQMYSPLRALGRSATGLSSSVAGAERVIDILRHQPVGAVHPSQDPDASVGRDRGPRHQPGSPNAVTLTCDRVSFRYPHGRQVLRELSFQVPAGGSLAVVGPSGAGKSTLTKLLLRFYDPDAGALQLNGLDMRFLELSELRSQIAVVMQETLIFDGTVRENILWAAPEASPQRFQRALDNSAMAGVVRELPQGLETRVGQRGRRLSGGQRQRLAIARAILRDAPMLILDEPTTGLDGATAQQIMTPLLDLMRGRTTIVITHDRALAERCDQVLELHGPAHDEPSEAAKPAVLSAQSVLRRGSPFAHRLTASRPEAVDDAAWWWGHG